MVVLVRSYGVWLALAVLFVAPGALAAGSSLSPFVRSSLDDDAPAPAPPSPRRIRSSLDDASHVSFPLDAEGRLIRLSLDEDGASYGHLTPSPSRSRHVRTALD